MGFWCSAAANLVGSLVAGLLVAYLAYSFLEQKFHLKERKGEQATVCNLIARELGQFGFSVGHLRQGKYETRIQPTAWEALKGSQALRFLPSNCLEPLLNAYAGIYTVSRWLERAELVEALTWAQGPSGAGSGLILATNLRTDAVKLAEETDKDCKRAAQMLLSEAQRLSTKANV